MTVTPRGVTGVPARPVSQRKADTLDLLRTERHLWLSTASGDGTPHLVPLAYQWDGSRVAMSTREDSRTVRNLRTTGKARVALGAATDVVLIEGSFSIVPTGGEIPFTAPDLLAELPLHPDRVPGCVYVFLTPYRVLAWRDRGEMRDKVVMAGGTWLG